MNTSTMSESGSSDRNDPKTSNDDVEYQDESKMEEIFPWQVKFNELCRAAVGSKSMKMLENLLTVYLQKGSGTVRDCYMKPNRAGKLKKCMSDALVFFHLFYQDIKESFENSTYLEKMTELMAMYLDIEIKASRRRKEHVKRVVCRLTSALNIFLDHSENHILDVIIRAKFINKNYREICSPVLGKLLTSLRVYPMNDTLYVRYLLVFKLWKKVVADADERKNINKIAIQNLPAPSNFMDRYKRFNNVLPRVPNSMNVTMFYMQAKFNLKTACQAFMKISKDPQQPIISDKPLFFEGRLASSQSTFSGKANAFECGVSRNLMNDIWSIAEPASSQKKSSSGENAKGDGTGKKAKEKSNKTGKKKTKDWFDKDKKKNAKNKSFAFGNFRESNSPTNVLPSGDSMESSISAKETATLTARPTTIESPLVPDAVNTQELGGETSSTPLQALPAVPKASTADPAMPETKPLLNSLTPRPQPKLPPCREMADIGTVVIDRKPSITAISLQTNEESILPSPHGEIPRIHLSPPDDVLPKVADVFEKNGIYCRKFEVNPMENVSNLLTSQVEEDTTSSPTLEVKNANILEVCAGKVVEAMETHEVIKLKDLNKSAPEEMVSSIAVAEYLDHEQDNITLSVLNEVTIATSELEISEENGEELPVYLDCQKEEVVIETEDQPSPVTSIDFTKNELTYAKEDQVVSGVVEVQSVIVPPSGSTRFKDCFTPSSHSPEVEQLAAEHIPVEREPFKFAVPDPPCMSQEQSIVIETREEVKTEMGSPPDDMTFPKEAHSMDEEMLPADWNQLPFGLFTTDNNSDIIFECMDMPSYEMDPVIDPCVIDPRMLEVGREPGQTVAKGIDPTCVTTCRPSEDFPQYGRMYTDAGMHRSRVESALPPQEFLADDYSSFNAAPDSYSYYSARDLYGNYNPNVFFDDSINQPPSRGGDSNRKETPMSSVESEAPPFNTVDYISGSLHSSNSSILSACDKDNLARHSRGMRVPINGDDYYRETDSLKSQDEQVLRKMEEPVGNVKSLNMKPPNTYNSTVVGEKHLLQKSVSNPHRKTPHPVAAQQDNRRSVGYSANVSNSTYMDCKVQLSHLRSEEVPSKPTMRGGTIRRNTRANPKKRAISPCPSTSSKGQNWFKHDAFFGDGGCDFGTCDFELDICDADRSDDADFHPDKKLKMDTNKRPVTRSISKETMLMLNSSMPITSRRKSRKPR